MAGRWSRSLFKKERGKCHCTKWRSYSIKKQPTISEVLEELYNVKQFRDGKIDLTNVSRYKAEIEAQNYLLSVKNLYNIPKEEILETKANLQYWKERLKNEKNRNY